MPRIVDSSDLADALRHIGIDTISGRPVADWLADNINDLPGHYFTVDSLAAALEYVGYVAPPAMRERFATAIIQAAKEAERE
jgi:hypothetical protein